MVKIAVFAKGDYAEAARKAGADYVGAEDLIEKIEGGWLDFNYAIATPDLMGLVGKVAKILGHEDCCLIKRLEQLPLMSQQLLLILKRGRLFFKNDKNGIVHFSFGRVSFDCAEVAENLSHL